jgi:subtilisin family serine protease
MKKFALLPMAALALAACQDPAAPVPVPVEPSLAAQAGQGVTDQYIVVFRDGVGDVPGLARALVAAHRGNLHFTYRAALKGFAARLPAGAAEALARHPSVQFVEQDQPMTIFTTQENATWGLDRTDQRPRALSTTFTYTNTGAGVTAYIIDTGILFTHSEFGGRAVSGYDAVDRDFTADDCNGHGTHVAGTVGGATYGVAKGVTLVGVRVLNCSGSGTTMGVIAGIDWVTANHQGTAPAVANMSLGGGASTALDIAVNNSIADGVSYAVAAGNGNWFGLHQDACRYSPARVPQAITVGATEKTDKKASWSNYGSCVDWFAPGVGITSAWYTSVTATRTISGTSMATPHVAGVAALYLQGTSGLTPAQVRDALYAATTKGVVTSSRTTNNHLLFSNY